MSFSPGDVVWYHNPDFPEKIHPHIILARNENESYLVVCSTKYEKIKKRCAFIERKDTGKELKTYVFVPARSSQTITSDSAINCNVLYQHNLNDIRSRDEYNFSAQHGDSIRPHLLEKIKTAIGYSTNINKDDKKMCGCPIDN